MSLAPEQASRKRRWSWRGPWLLTAACVIGFFAAWEWISATGLIHSVILPGPADTLERLLEIVQESGFRQDLFVTLQEIVIGLVIGCGAAVVTALACVRYPLLRKVAAPYIATLQAIPKITILPLLGIWFGLGMTSAIIIVALVSFFPTYLNTLTGLTLTDEDGLRLLHSLGASRRQAFWMYRIPTALPLAFTGFKTSVNYAVVASITAEFLGADQGLGHLVTSATTYLQIPTVYAAVAAIAIVAGVIYVGIEALDRKLIFWRVDLDESERDER